MGSHRYHGRVLVDAEANKKHYFITLSKIKAPKVINYKTLGNSILLKVM